MGLNANIGILEMRQREEGVVHGDHELPTQESAGLVLFPQYFTSE
jgi:hypothetical protein